MLRFVLLVPVFLGVIACSDPKDASKANFKAAIQSYFDTRPACLSFGRFPREVWHTARGLNERHLLSQKPSLDELVGLGFLSSEPIEKTVRVLVSPYLPRETKTIPGTRYGITEEGLSASVADEPDSLQLCYASYRVVEVSNFTEPGSMLGVTVSTASFTYEAVEIADWARNSEILRNRYSKLARDLQSTGEPISQQAMLELTENGWMAGGGF